MSDELSFEDIIYHLTKNPDGAARAEAARILGSYVSGLSEAEYDTAFKALNNALTDPDPTVLMAAMNALSNYNRRGAALAPDVAEDDDEAVVAATCAVCGKPEALVDPAHCPHDNCPYK